MIRLRLLCLVGVGSANQTKSVPSWVSPARSGLPTSLETRAALAWEAQAAVARVMVTGLAVRTPGPAQRASPSLP
jgi:hypothetical protein